MSRTSAPFICLALLAIACNFGDRDEIGRTGDGQGRGGGAASADASAGGGGVPGRSASGLVEGKDYVVFERVRLLDEMGFDRPVEAMSLLMPRGWRAEGGVRWKGVGECRSEIVTWQVRATSPDGQIQYAVMPARSFGSSQDQMTRQALMAGAQQGGCQVSEPFDAAEYLEHWARAELGGASVSDVHTPEEVRPRLAQLDAQANEVARQYGTGMNQTLSFVIGTLAWPDGSKGQGYVMVNNSVKYGNDPFTGAPDGFSTTNVSFRAYIRYPPAREEEALKLAKVFDKTYRINPVWAKATEDFLTRLGNAEHAGRMERIRLMGEQAAAYARSQSDAADARMRDWERRQSSSDANQERFIQTIRGVETWKDSGGGAVELSAGYQHGWSRPDGSYILTNNSLFDPAVEFQQNWSRMEKAQR